MKSVFLVALVVFGFVAHLSAQTVVKVRPVPATNAPAPLKVEGIVIQTNAKVIEDKAFIAKITAALTLLKNRSPEDLKLIQTYIGIIRAWPASGANFNEQIMTIDIGKQTFDASLEWLTSVLVHEATHIKKYKDSGKKFGDAHLMSDKKAAFKVMVDEEMECNRAQLVTLGKIGGSKFEIDYLKAQKGDHFDIDKDGDYDNDDYKGRSWE
ncbi:MAG: hypothetical protein KA956_05925 [Pyrinomonadaceae bacterium]|nr:hypothetical protein [Pyrinomonadaceae bacterium]